MFIPVALPALVNFTLRNTGAAVGPDGVTTMLMPRFPVKPFRLTY